MNYAEIAQGARDWALKKIGCRYSQAKRTQENIFDCSSLVARAYSAQGKAWGYGGRVPLSCYEVYDDDFQLLWPESFAAIGKTFGGSSVIAKATQLGDLQFLCTDKNSGRANKITHVTMVASASKIVHARGTAYRKRMLPFWSVLPLTRREPSARTTCPVSPSTPYGFVLSHSSRGV